MIVSGQRHASNLIASLVRSYARSISGCHRTPSRHRDEHGQFWAVTLILKNGRQKSHLTQRRAKTTGPLAGH